MVSYSLKSTNNTMKPFLIFLLRPEADVAQSEFDAFLRFGNLSESDVLRVDLLTQSVPENISLDDYSGLIVGGGPSNVSDSQEKKSTEQKRFEADLSKLLDKIVERDFPFFGNCYGLGALAVHQGAIVSKEKYGEEAGPVTITLTKEGRRDPLLKDLPSEFRAFLGHKEACQKLPESAVLLATDEACPVQLMRIKQNVYGCQFHVELDADGMETRINAYKHLGYFAPENADELISKCKQENINVPMKILSNFVSMYKKD